MGLESGSNWYAKTRTCVLRVLKLSVMVKPSKTKEAEPMDNQPIIFHISQMLADLDEEPIRAVYMVVRQLHQMQPSENRIT